MATTNLFFKALEKAFGEDAKVFEAMEKSAGPNGLVQAIVLLAKGTPKINSAYKPYVEKYSLGRERNTMPQISDENLLDFLLHFAHTNKVQKTIRKARDLKPAQAEFNEEKIANGVKYKSWEGRPFVVSSDNYLVDGHHSWAAAMEVDPDAELICYRIDLPIKTLLSRALASRHTYVDKTFKGFLAKIKNALLPKKMAKKDYAKALTKAAKCAQKAAQGTPAFKEKFERVMKEFKNGTLHSGSPDGPPVTDRTQAIRIAFEEARAA